MSVNRPSTDIMVAAKHCLQQFSYKFLKLCITLAREKPGPDQVQRESCRDDMHIPSLSYCAHSIATW